MPKLIVELDSVAALRAAGRSPLPDPAAAAVLAELAGADGVAVRLRKDRRSIQDRELPVLRGVVHTRLVVKMAPTTELLGVVLTVKPDAVTLVAEELDEYSPDAGLDLTVHGSSAAEMIENIAGGGMAAGVLIEPDPEQLKLAHRCGARFVAVNTGSYCGSPGRRQVLSRIVDTVKLANRLKVGVHAGGGIGFDTIGAFKDLEEIDTFVIGHGIVSRALMVGMQQAVLEMQRLISAL
jgi:pyridoxine 5-phosphate synthase